MSDEILRVRDGPTPGYGFRGDREYVAVVKSINFEFLRKRRSYLADLGGFAEQYLHPDPASALVKLRLFGESLVNDCYAALGLQQPFESDFLTILDGQPFKDSVPPVVTTKLHAVRKLGNRAAHGAPVDFEMARRALHEAYHVATWLHLTIDSGAQGDCSPFVLPPDGGIAGATKSDLKREKKAALEKLAAQEAQMERLLTELEQARARAEIASKTAQELQAIVVTGRRVASELAFNEAETRKYLVDSMLASAGWEVAANGENSADVGQEVDVEHQPTQTGKGKADYVLWDPAGKPLAVVEVKKTSIEAALGQAQARLYADGFERMYGRRPVIFYTNGFDLYIWDDAQKQVARKIYGFYSKDSLAYLHFQRANAKPLESIPISPEITERLYQVEAIKRVCDRFDQGRRRALIVQATGSGKTRVAISLADVLLRADRAKRILFLCDRRELRKQALNAFKLHLPNAKRVTVTATTAKEREHQIYLATYPAMNKCFETFDVGFFDLVIADESHRSIYNRYRDLFRYFDALQVGLTATPVRFIDRNTYDLFGCEDQDPTAHYPLDRAIDDDWLVPFRARAIQTGFQRKGMKWSEMSDAQRAQLEQQIANAESFDYDAPELDRLIFNKDTNRVMLRNLMDNGIRDAAGQHPGKTVIFGRSHRHALLLKELFDEMYPQYGGPFCTVIDNYDPRSEQLIDDFKGQGQHNDIQIAISVDMLDTGVDVPEIVNLVFAKPVKSYVKFWQMIGRGTRKCQNLFGPGQHKEEFFIFDHWGNFDYFGTKYVEPSPSPRKSLLQQLFEARVALADAALKKPELAAFDAAVEFLRQDIVSLEDTGALAVRDAWRTIKKVNDAQVLQQFDPATQGALLQDVAPLMKERDIRGHVEAHDFDLLMACLQLAHIRGSSGVQNGKADLLNAIAELQMNLAPVKAKADAIARVKSAAFWDDLSFSSLEEARLDLRGIMRFRQRPATPLDYARIVDVSEDPMLLHDRDAPVKLDGLEEAAYRKRVEQVLRDLVETSETLRRIKAGKPVARKDLEELVSLVLTQSPALDLKQLERLYPKTAGHLDLAIRRIIGLDAGAVEQRFQEFLQHHPGLRAQQVRFLSLLKSLIASAGAIELNRLYEPPFTTLDSDGIDGVFEDERQIDELLDLIASFENPDLTQVH